MGRGSSSVKAAGGSGQTGTPTMIVLLFCSCSIYRNRDLRSNPEVPVFVRNSVLYTLSLLRREFKQSARELRHVDGLGEMIIHADLQ